MVGHPAGKGLKASLIYLWIFFDKNYTINCEGWDPRFLTVIYRISPSLNTTDHICSIGKKMKKKEKNFILQTHFYTFEILTKNLN